MKTPCSSIRSVVLILDGSSNSFRTCEWKMVLKEYLKVEDCCRFKLMPYTDQVPYWTRYTSRKYAQMIK